MGTACGDDDIDENFDNEEFDRGCAAVKDIMDSGSAYGELSSIWILILGSIAYTDASVRDVLPLVYWEICLVGDKNVFVPVARPGMP